MSTSTDGILAYGYDLGEGFQKIQGAGEYGELPPLPWFDAESDDMIEAAEHRLLAAPLQQNPLAAARQVNKDRQKQYQRLAGDE